MIAYFDCTNGVAGDMLVASLLGAGASWTKFQSMLSGLKVHGYSLELSDVKRAGIGAKHFNVVLEHAHHHHHRDLGTILQMIQGAALPARVIERACRVFTRLGEAEAEVHQCDIAKVHFHEVGAIDAIVDIVGACICLELLDVDTVFYSRIAVGSGQVKGAHGVLPVPAPATARLLLGSEFFSGDRTGELATPTGAAILTALGTQQVYLPELRLKTIGYGAGTRDDAGQPNVVRVFVGNEGHQLGQTDEVTVIDFNVDNMTGEHLGWLTEQLMTRGALDVGQIPMSMKKSRPATLVEVIAEPARTDELVRFILTQSTSFGVRTRQEKRHKLGREFVDVDLPGGRVRVKVGYLDGRAVQISPEYEDCRTITEKTGNNFRQVYAQAAERARQLLGDDVHQD